MSENRFARVLLCLLVLGLSATGALGENILFIVNDPSLATYPNDALLGDFFKSLGHTVTYFDDNESEAAMEAAAAAADLVWISESVGSGNVANKITGIETPMVVGEPYAWDEMGMTLNSPCITSDVATTDIEIISPSHFLAAGLSGTVTVLTKITGSAGTAQFANGRAGPEATVIATATLADGQTYDVILVYDKGVKLAVPPGDGSPQVAADVRIGMFFHYFAHDVLNENAYALIEAAMRYGLGVTPQARNPQPPDGSLYADTWANLSWSPGNTAVSHDVYFGESFDDVNDATRDSAVYRGNQTSTFFIVGFPGYLYPDGLVPGTTYYWRIDEVEADGVTIHKGYVWRFSIPPKTAYNPDPANGAEFVGPDNVTLTWTPGFGAKLHHVYLGTNLADVEAGAPGAYKGPAGAARFVAGKLESEKVYYWRVDEFDGAGTYKGDIWAFTTPGAAGNPRPARGATGVQMVAKLSWTPATNATSHQVYLGTDKEAVKNSTTASPEYKGSKTPGNETLDPGKLAWHTSYYWRVDAVYNTGTVTGLVWSFTTADFLLVDDFESYNDIDPPDPASNRIFDAWIDGFATPTTNGALVGNDMPPYAERTIVRGGAQSMPYRYDNANKTSEATLTLVYPRDWTEEGVTRLSLWFRGDPANAAERMYVALNGSAVVYHADPAVTQKGGWNQWIIDLQTFPGVTLTNVNTIAIGFGTKNSPAAGGSGKMYFDDIRLYRP